MYREKKDKKFPLPFGIITQYLEICNTKNAKNCGFIKSLDKMTILTKILVTRLCKT